MAFSDGWQTNQQVNRRGWRPEGLRAHFTAALQHAPATDSNLIMSGEDITDIPAADLRDFLAFAATCGFAVHPVIFVRPPLEFVISMTETRVRHGHPCQPYAVGMATKVEMSLQIWPDLRTIAFRDAIKHKFGPFGAMMDEFGLPSADRFNLIKQNESMSDQATRLIGYMHSQIPLIVNGAVSPSRAYLDTEPITRIKGAKFKLPGLRLPRSAR